MSPDETDISPMWHMKDNGKLKVSDFSKIFLVGLVIALVAVKSLFKIIDKEIPTPQIGNNFVVVKIYLLSNVESREFKQKSKFWT